MARQLNIMIAGAAGDGIQTIGELLSFVCHRAGLFVFSMDDFQSRIRGGHSYHLLRISDQPLSAPAVQPDVIVAMGDNAMKPHLDLAADAQIVFVNGDPEEKHPEMEKIQYIPLKSIAKDCGAALSANSVAAGAIFSMMGGQGSEMDAAIEDLFAPRGGDVVTINKSAAEKGMQFVREFHLSTQFDFSTRDHVHVTLSGAKAAALGALAADCRFVSFYPMSPGTGIVTSALPFQETLPLVIEQAEDEIAAVNMAIGASFAGVRSLVSTSGGGFCLMTEGLGLSAMAEIPIVVIDAQRPGPATGLATRTAQADLMFVIHASQDDFPRFVFAPGGVHETYEAVKRAFFLSEKYQVPAIVLMDQFLADSQKTEKRPLEIGSAHQSFLDRETSVSQNEPYQRYKFTDSGVSPRKIPCDSDALVRSTGNEHTPLGISTEDPGIRNQMVEKRFRKLGAMTKEMHLPSVFCEDAAFLLTGWGSTKGSIMEACLSLRENGMDVGWIIFEDLWPMDRERVHAILKNKKMIMVEANPTCQLGNLIRLVTGLDYHCSVLKYDGRPFFPEYIIDKVTKMIG